ncbi:MULTISPECIES: tRNA-dihydrouridine synthase [Streptomyces]|uniref:Ant5 n=1 Tax=Streptomyces venezuelae TaxID=54571 RepID=A0A5B9T6Q7_STRVZ|nr:tRNA-dihydrouridine synthase [Streptomyces venezuelae]MYY86842.1 dihydroorotate dehydrogenase [Streptomyces sp. SID335]MYZ11933.1 dihydroorotate dehydrogenase [Streptomyces sp. SID337]NDZ90586.1 dihydroorotate dehydrogenase [Streptomyces sp. SID10115]NDZ99835.1 dihydroorotate dehydrogenase [Streptomyces sp. SID10116]NEB46056.1 dihydroorotate dehydrogenase [Streptomyces sp. SID339]
MTAAEDGANGAEAPGAAATAAPVEILGLRLKSPVVVGSGLLTDQERNIRRLLDGGAGAVVTKTIHPNPGPPGNERLLRLPTGMLNSTTYSRRSVDDWCAMLRRFADDDLPVITSVHADSPAELADLAERVTEAGSTALELGISCLNEEDGGLEDTPERVAAYTEAVRSRTPVPISVKLAIGERVRERVDAATASGADALTLSDTISGLAVDADTGEVRLGGAFGYSGPGIKPLVLAEIYGLRRDGLTVPVMASGGVNDAVDVAEYLSVGADAVQVYTVLHKNMHATLRAIRQGFDDWLASHGGTVADLVGRSIKGA